MDDRTVDVANDIIDAKKYRKYIIIKLSVLFGVSTLLMFLSVLFMSIGGGKFSSSGLIGILILFQIICMLLSLGFLSYHLLKDVQIDHYHKYYKFYDLVQFVLLAVLVFFFLQTFIFKNARVSGSSMEPTLHNGDVVFVMQIHDHYSYDDVVVMNAIPYPDLDTETFLPKPGIISSESFYVKRIKAIPGQRISYIEIENGLEFYVEGQLVQTITMSNHIKILKHIVDVNNGIVPKRKFLLFGDNHGNSKDSRVFGLVDQKDILGIVKIRLLKKPGLIK